MLDQVEKNDKKLSGYEKTSEINNGKKERKKLTREENKNSFMANNKKTT